MEITGLTKADKYFGNSEYGYALKIQHDDKIFYKIYVRGELINDSFFMYDALAFKLFHPFSKINGVDWLYKKAHTYCQEFLKKVEENENENKMFV